MNRKQSAWLAILALILSMILRAWQPTAQAEEVTLEQDVYISEVYAVSGAEKYIELYFNKEVPAASYYLMTATSETATLSATLSFSVEQQAAGSYYLIDGDKVKDNLSLNNPSSASYPTRFVWLCPSKASSKEICRSTQSIDSMQYFNHGPERSFSRDFNDAELSVRLSLKTPGQPNLFPTDDSEDSSNGVVAPCSQIKFNEISFASKESAFVEVVNDANQAVNLSGCSVRRGKNEFPLSGDIAGGGVRSFALASSKLVLSNSSVKLYLMDAANEYDSVNYLAVKTNANYASQASYAWFDDEEHFGWLQTFAPTPGAPNQMQNLPTCVEGKIYNPDTGNCVNAPAGPAACQAGQYRNPETGRCKKVDSGSALAACAAGQYRNPETNRCKKLASETSTKACQDGWERNPETNRCRKKVDGSAAGFAVENAGATPETKTLLAIAGGGAALTAAMIGFSFREDLRRWIYQLRGKF